MLRGKKIEFSLQWHLSIVRNLSDLPMTRCELPDCCKARYHCPLCTVTKLKPNHLYHMRQHFVSHWRSGVKFKGWNTLCFGSKGRGEVIVFSGQVRQHSCVPLMKRRQVQRLEHALFWVKGKKRGNCVFWPMEAALLCSTGEVASISKV